MPEPVHIVTRPHITVKRIGPHGPISYDANNLAVVTHDGRYHLSFVCSGQLTLIPAVEVEGIEFHRDGAQWCLTCDSRLTSWPANDPGYHKEINPS